MKILHALREKFEVCIMCHAHNRLATAVADYYRLLIVSLAC